VICYRLCVQVAVKVYLFSHFYPLPYRGAGINSPRKCLYFVAKKAKIIRIFVRLTRLALENYMHLDCIYTKGRAFQNQFKHSLR